MFSSPIKCYSVIYQYGNETGLMLVHANDPDEACSRFVRLIEHPENTKIITLHPANPEEIS